MILFLESMFRLSYKILFHHVVCAKYIGLLQIQDGMIDTEDLKNKKIKLSVENVYDALQLELTVALAQFLDARQSTNPLILMQEIKTMHNSAVETSTRSVGSRTSSIDGIGSGIMSFFSSVGKEKGKSMSMSLSDSRAEDMFQSARSEWEASLSAKVENMFKFGTLSGESIFSKLGGKQPVTDIVGSVTGQAPVVDAANGNATVSQDNVLTFCVADSTEQSQALLQMGKEYSQHAVGSSSSLGIGASAEDAMGEDEKERAFFSQRILSLSSLSSLSSKSRVAGSSPAVIVPISAYFSALLTQAIKASPYNITMIFKPVTMFNQRCADLILPTCKYACNSSSQDTEATSDEQRYTSKSHLREFINAFVKIYYLPRLEADVAQCMDLILGDASAFAPREKKKDSFNLGISKSAHANGKSRLLSGGVVLPNNMNSLLGAEENVVIVFKSSIDVTNVVRRIMVDVAHLPFFCADLLKVSENVLAQYVDRLAAKLAEQNTDRLLSVERIKEESVYKAFKLEDPLYGQLRRLGDYTGLSSHQVNDSDVNSAPQQDEMLENFLSCKGNLFNILFTDKFASIAASKLCFNPRVWSLWCIMTQTLEWMSNQMYEPLQDDGLHINASKVLMRYHATGIRKHLEKEGAGLSFLEPRANAKRNRKMGFGSMADASLSPSYSSLSAWSHSDNFSDILRVDAQSQMHQTVTASLCTNVALHNVNKNSAFANTYIVKVLSDIQPSQLSHNQYASFGDDNGITSHRRWVGQVWGGVNLFDAVTVRPLRESEVEKSTRQKIIETKQRVLALACVEFANKCLFIMRHELIAHIAFFLRDIQVGNYLVRSSATEPDPFVLSLNKDLASIEEVLTKYLDAGKLHYVFEGAAFAITDFFINGIIQLKDKRMSKKGVEKLQRNLSALQQNLQHLITTQDTYFERAKTFLDLLLFNEEDLTLFEKANPQVFTDEEYQTMHAVTIVSDKKALS
jgi:hypothetical protein